MKETKLVFGVVGLVMGRRQLKAAIAKGFEIGGICDCNPSTLKIAGDECGVPEEKRFLDYKELVKNPEINAVVIATPDQLHRTMVEEFLEAGKHVLCEKPLAITREDLNAIVAAEKKNAPKPIEPAPIPAPVTAKPAPGSAGQLKLHNVEPKTAAMLMAIVADKLGKPINELRFISIKEVDQ